MYYIPGTEQSTQRGKRLLMWGYFLQVPEDALSSVLVDDQERQQSSSVPFGKVHPQVKAGFESRLADLLPPVLFELVQQTASSQIQAIYSVAPRSYARDRLCLAGDAGAVFPPFTASGVLKAMANATTLADALADASAVEDALRRWSEAQLQVAAQVMPIAERIEQIQGGRHARPHHHVNHSDQRLDDRSPSRARDRETQSPSLLHSGRPRWRRTLHLALYLRWTVLRRARRIPCPAHCSASQQKLSNGANVAGRGTSMCAPCRARLGVLAHSVTRHERDTRGEYPLLAPSVGHLCRAHAGAGMLAVAASGGSQLPRLASRMVAAEPTETWPAISALPASAL
jgi:hypothetical protein